MSPTPNSPMPSHSSGWQQATRYPDPAITALDPSFEKYWLKLSCVERLASGCRWAEGPVYFGDGRFLLWSDIPNNRILKWEEETGAVSVYRKPSTFANGNTRDRQGRLVTCEHGGRRVTRTEYDGSIRVLMDSFDGKRLNSPNDVVVKSDGSVWFTDPVFGILGDYEGYKAEPEIETEAASLVQRKIRPLDALHLAFASYTNADYFCTCDDKLLKKSKRLTDLSVKVVSPLELIAEVAQ